VLKKRLLPELTEQNQSRLLAKQFYKTGDLQPLIDFIEKRYFKVFDNRDYGTANELTIKTAFLTLLFNDTFYIMDSETEFERRFADLTMIVRPERRKSALQNFLLDFNVCEFRQSRFNRRESQRDECRGDKSTSQSQKEVRRRESPIA